MSDLLKYIMAIPTVYSCTDETLNFQMNQHITIKSELPLTDEDYKGIKELIPIIYIITIKNIYNDGIRINRLD